MYVFFIILFVSVKRIFQKSEVADLTTRLKMSEDKIKSLEQSLSEANIVVQTNKNAHTDKDAQIQTLTSHVNELEKARKEFWNIDVTPVEYINLTIKNRVKIDDIIWCLVEWSQVIESNENILQQSNDNINLEKDQKNNNQDNQENNEHKVYESNQEQPTTKLSSKTNCIYFWTRQNIFLKKVCQSMILFLFLFLMCFC